MMQPTETQKFVTASEIRDCRPFLVLPEGPQFTSVPSVNLIRFFDTLEAAMTLLEEYYRDSEKADCGCETCNKTATLLKGWRSER